MVPNIQNIHIRQKFNAMLKHEIQKSRQETHTDISLKTQSHKAVKFELKERTTQISNITEMGFWRRAAGMSRLKII